MSTRGVSSPNELRWFRLLWLSLVVMRCQPLRRALAFKR
ncbi:exlusion protein FxsA [Vibrio cholerae]|nr:exlusion protein FxsA [Vibrio cholerae]